MITMMMLAMLASVCVAVPMRGRVDTILSKCYIRSGHVTPYKSTTYPPHFSRIVIQVFNTRKKLPDRKIVVYRIPQGDKSPCHNFPVIVDKGVHPLGRVRARQRAGYPQTEIFGFLTYQPIKPTEVAVWASFCVVRRGSFFVV